MVWEILFMLALVLVFTVYEWVHFSRSKSPTVNPAQQGSEHLPEASREASAHDLFELVGSAAWQSQAQSEPAAT